MINARISAAEAAARLGVKPATVYAYVSRGLLRRERTPEGSTFDPQEVARLARSGRQPGSENARRERTASEPVFVTTLTLIDGGRLYYRGLDAVELSRERAFEEVAAWLWTGTWPAGPEVWSTPPAAGEAVAAALAAVAADILPIERFMVAVNAAALSDDLRHDLSPAAVPVVGRALLPALVEALPTVRPASVRSGGSPAPTAPQGSLAARLWPRLSPLPATPGRIALLDAALVLVADHELAPSTLAARVAAAFRADPYAVVSTGLGPASGSWHLGSSGAPTEVERLLGEAATTDPERAIGERLRRTGSAPHGFGMPLYAGGDPRGAEILGRLLDIEGSPDRHATVLRVLEIAAERAFPAPNVDLGLGALAFCGEMVPGAGQAISTLGKVAGWLAHAMEEYASPTLFRTRAEYVGRRPGGAA